MFWSKNENEIDGNTLKDWLDGKNDIHLIDVRSTAEVAQGMIQGAKNVPLHTLPLRLEDLPQDKKIVIYCSSGNRSTMAYNYLKQNMRDHDQYDIYHLRRGLFEWYGAGQSVVRSKAA